MNLDCPSDPLKFCEEVIKIDLNPEQIEALKYYLDNRIPNKDKLLINHGHNPPVLEKQIRVLSPTRLKIDEEDLISDSNLLGGY